MQSMGGKLWRHPPYAEGVMQGYMTRYHSHIQDPIELEHRTDGGDVTAALQPSESIHPRTDRPLD